MWQLMGQQLRCPSGLGGRLAGRLMSMINRAPYRIAIARLNVQESDDILEIGFGPGLALKTLSKLAPQGHIIGLDQSAVMLRQAQSCNRHCIAAGRMSLFRGSFEALPLADASIDKVLAVNTVYFFRPDGKAIAEIYRVLRPGGIMVLFAVDQISMRKWRFAGPETHRTFDKYSLQTFLQTGGFDASSIEVTPIRLALRIRALTAVLRKN